MNDIKPVSQQFFENVLEHSTDQKRKTSLERIKTACDALDKKSKTTPYTVADIGRYCEQQWGGPKTQSIRNAPDVLEKYAKLRVSEHSDGLAETPEAASKKVLNLADPALAQQQYFLALAENEQLRQEVARLKADVDRYAPMTPDQLLEAAKNGGPATSNAVEVFSALPAEVVGALKSLFDPERLRGCELILDRNGYLIHEISGNELLTATEVLALKALA